MIWMSLLQTKFERGRFCDEMSQHAVRGPHSTLWLTDCKNDETTKFANNSNDCYVSKQEVTRFFAEATSAGLKQLQRATISGRRIYKNSFLDSQNLSGTTCLPALFGPYSSTHHKDCTEEDDPRPILQGLLVVAHGRKERAHDARHHYGLQQAHVPRVNDEA